MQTVRIDYPEKRIGRIIMARPQVRNAQNHMMTYELNSAFNELERDDAIKVIILAGDGPHFSAGHDMRETGAVSDHTAVGGGGRFASPAAEGLFAREDEIYLQMCLRWRNLSKPTIAQVNGKAIAGGLMLAWCCDLIVASHDAMFADGTVAMGTNGVEYFAHPWELGTRKAKELLFTGDFLTAEECHRLGMINHVVEPEKLEEFTLGLARKISLRPSFGLRLAKMSCNMAQDAQGFGVAMQSAFGLHQLAHSHNQERFGIVADPGGIPEPILKSMGDQLKLPQKAVDALAIER